MRGVSAVIAVILLLMITVALAATSYVWFSSVFTMVTAGGTNITERGVIGITTAFTIESARYVIPNNVTVVVRNTGTAEIDLATAAAYISDRYVMPVVISTPTRIATGAIGQLNVSNSTIGAVCTSPIRISFGAGVPQTSTITC